MATKKYWHLGLDKKKQQKKPIKYDYVLYSLEMKFTNIVFQRNFNSKAEGVCICLF